MRAFDCRSCGACCCNTATNLRDGRREYVEVARTDALFREHKELLKTLAVRSPDGSHHLRLVGEEQRCVALAGEVGVDVSCEIYALRPRGCRRVEPGDGECLRARRHHGLPVEEVLA